MLSCLGFRKSRRKRDPSRSRPDEQEPLLPQYHDDTTLQARAHEKLHTYQMLRALAQGYMPSTDQVIVHLQSLLSAQALNPDTPELSDAGRALLRSLRLWLQQFIDVLQHKNSDDQMQDFIWCLGHARLSVGLEGWGARAALARAEADSQATYHSLQTIASLLLSNADFRIFLNDVATVGRDVFHDAAFRLADVSQQVGSQIEPAMEERELLKKQDDDARPAPTRKDLEREVRGVSQVVVEGATDVVEETGHSISEHVDGEEKAALVGRLKRAVLRLRQRPDYADSVSTLALLLQRYAMIYAHAASDTVEALEEDIEINPEADRALRQFWELLASFGDPAAWERLEQAFKTLLEDGRDEPHLDRLIREFASLVQNMLSDPDFFETAESRFAELRDKSKALVTKSSFADDVDRLSFHLRSALESAKQDAHIHKLSRTTRRIADIVSPAGQSVNSQLMADAVHVFVPLLVQAIECLPIPRLEISTPAVDVLLENLLLEPGRSVKHSSFLPYKVHISTQNNVDICKGTFRTSSSLTSLVKLKVSGLSVAADDVGYWMKLHSGMLRWTDEGLAGFHLDERGIDIALEIEVGRERLEEMVTLRNVKVDVHRLGYTLSKSRLACLAWVFKPLIRPVLRRALEVKLCSVISDSLRALNRELVFARERLRATRVAHPGDVWTFLRAVAARPMQPGDPDVEVRAGVWPGAGVFRDRYAPGSLVQLWEREVRPTAQRVREYERGGWRNAIFDVTARRL